MRRKWIAIGVVLVLAGGGLALGLGLTRGGDPVAEAPPAPSGAIALPSGRAVTFHDSIWGEPGTTGLTVRFRFLEPDLRAVIASTQYEDIEADMKFLCETYALARIANTGPQPVQVVVSISDRQVEFGAPDPDVTQIFEAYRPDNSACVWEWY